MKNSNQPHWHGRGSPSANHKRANEFSSGVKKELGRVIERVRRGRESYIISHNRAQKSKWTRYDVKYSIHLNFNQQIDREILVLLEDCHTFIVI